jgi:cytochrome c-type biogenesis protein CcmH/NrfG
LLRYGTLLLLTFFLLQNVNRQESVQWVLFSFLAIAGFVALYALFQFVKTSPTVWGWVRPTEFSLRPGGTFFNPTHVVPVYLVALVLSFGFALLGRLPHWGKALLYYNGILQVIALALTFSQPAWWAAVFMLGVVLVVVLAYRDFRWHAAAACVVVLLFGAAFHSKTARLQSRLAPYLEEASIERSALHDMGLNAWKVHPWFGVGAGGLPDALRPERRDVIQGYAESLENDWLHFAAEWGLGGLLAVSLLIAVFLWTSVLTWPHVQRVSNDLGTKRSNKAAVVLGGAIGVCGLIVYGFYGSAFQIPINLLIAAVIISAVTSYGRFYTEKYWIRPGLLGRIAVTAAACAALVYLVQGTAREWVCTKNLQAANHLQPGSAENLRSLERALAAKPTDYRALYLLAEGLREASQLETEASAKGSLLAKARESYVQAMSLNPYDPLPLIGYGLCLDAAANDVQGRTVATSYFRRAGEKDPNNYLVQAFLGWHLTRVGQLDEARARLRRSMELQPLGNSFARETFRAVEFLRSLQAQPVRTEEGVLGVKSPE